MKIKDEINTAIEFKTFYVEKILKSGKAKKDATLEISIDDNIRVDQNDITVELSLNIDEEDGDFNLQMTMNGLFRIEADYIETFKPNLLAIMFPYLRSAVSYISSIDGQGSIILPPINFVEYSRQQKEDE